MIPEIRSQTVFKDLEISVIRVIFTGSSELEGLPCQFECVV